MAVGACVCRCVENHVSLWTGKLTGVRFSPACGGHPMVLDARTRSHVLAFFRWMLMSHPPPSSSMCLLFIRPGYVSDGAAVQGKQGPGQLREQGEELPRESFLVPKRRVSEAPLSVHNMKVDTRKINYGWRVTEPLVAKIPTLHLIYLQDMHSTQNSFFFHDSEVVTPLLYPAFSSIYLVLLVPSLPMHLYSVVDSNPAWRPSTGWCCWA